MFIPIILILTLAVSGGVSVVADSSLPGDVLYPIKIGVNENVASFLAMTSEAEARWAVRRAERRLEEAADLQAQNRLDTETRTELYAAVAEDMRKAEEHARAVAAAGDTKTANDLNLRIQTSLRIRADALGNAVIGTDATITAATDADTAANTGSAASDTDSRHSATFSTRFGTLTVSRDGQSIVLRGTLSRPTPCAEWEITGSTTHAAPSLVVFSITNKNKGTVCMQVLGTPQTVSARMEAEAAATIKVILEGETVFSGVLIES